MFRSLAHEDQRATWIAQGTVYADEGAGRASRVYLFEIK
jgi:hypothetical protein